MSGELPKGWAEATLADITDYVQRGKSPKYATTSALPVINQKCVRWWGIDREHVKYVSEEQWSSWDQDRYIQHHDILWNSTGTGTIGRAALYKNRGTAESIVCDSHVTIVRANRDISPEYVYWHIRSPFVQNKIESMQTGSTNQVELSKSEILSTSIPVPPEREQKRIVRKIDALFTRSRSAREDLAHIPKLIERYRQAVLEAAFRGDLTADWRKDNPSETGDGLKESVLGERKRHWEMLSLSERRRRYPAPEEADWFPDTEIPSQWTWMSVDQLAYQIQYGSSAKTGDDDSGTPVLRMGNIHRGKIRFDSLKYLPDDHEEFPELLLKPGDILFNRTNSAELVGKTAVYEGNLRSASFASYLIRLKVSGIIPTLLAHYINSPFGRRWINSVVNQQVGQANVNGTKLSRLAVPVMSASEQAILIQRLNQRLFAVEAIEQEMRKSDGMLSRLDQAILDKAFAGKLVPQDSNDEPASALLERIKAARVAAPRARRGRRPAVA